MHPSLQLAEPAMPTPLLILRTLKVCSVQDFANVRVQGDEAPVKRDDILSNVVARRKEWRTVARTALLLGELVPFKQFRDAVSCFSQAA